ncbi:hypothetical protein H4Q26_003069 [Puccinia striiformis f. sp. tritici PST-130]|nr:hypothetical protein H4Q26_003069 [Puccinia striiformis f. sp. tritici PST-130]
MASLFERITPSELSLTATSRILVSHLAVGTSLDDVILAFEDFGRIEECTLTQRYLHREVKVSAVICLPRLGKQSTPQASWTGSPQTVSVCR